MPNFAVTINETHKNVVRPVVLEAVRRVLSMTGLPADTKVQFPSSGGQYQQPKSTHSTKDKDVTFGTDTRFWIEVTETPVEERFLTTGVLTEENVVVFADAELDVYVRPVYAKMDVTISIRYRAHSKTEAQRWWNDLRMRVSRERVENLHELTYSYAIPDEVLVILHYLWEMREAVAPYGETLKKWFNDHFTRRITSLTNQSGKQFLLSVGETQIGVIGYFDFMGVPSAPEKDGETGAYTVSFDYKFTYSKPISVAIKYPLVIHNQIVPPMIRPEDPPLMPTERLHYSNHSRHVLDQLMYWQPWTNQALDGISIPYYDDWVPERVLPRTSALLKIMLRVDPEDRRDLFDLDELGYYELDEDLLAFLREHHDYIGVPYESPVGVVLHVGEKDFLPATALEVGPDLHVRSTFDLDLRKRYHARVHLTHDLSMLSRAASERLRLAGPLCLKLFAAIDPTLASRGLMPELVAGRLVSRRDYDVAVHNLTRKQTVYYTHADYGFRTVGNFVIQTKPFPPRKPVPKKEA